MGWKELLAARNAACLSWREGLGEVGGGGGPCSLPVTVIRCILELPGEIRSFPGSRCNGEVPAVWLLTCAPLAGKGEGWGCPAGILRG